MTSKNLLWHSLTAQLYLTFLLVTQQEVPFTNTSETTKRLSNQTENGKCTNVTNPRSHEGLVNPILHKPATITRHQICFGENIHCPAYLWT